MTKENPGMEKVLAELVAAVEERIQFSARSARMQSVLEDARRLLQGSTPAASER
jgi:hypothetical protein